MTRAEHSAAAVAYMTIAVGAVALVAPDRLAGLGGVRADAGWRAVGTADLLIAAGILFSPRRSHWLRARAAANPPTAVFLWSLGGRSGATLPRALAVILCGASLADLATARELARGE